MRNVIVLLIILALTGCTSTMLKKKNYYVLRLGKRVTDINTTDQNIAIQGYDPVAYFTINKPAKGDNQLTFSWQGADWQFSTQENLELFKNNPEKYAPVYGGYCSWSVANNNYLPPDTGNPEAWKIVDGKLYLTFSKGVRRLWNMKLKKNLVNSEVQWPIKIKTMRTYQNQ